MKFVIKQKVHVAKGLFISLVIAALGVFVIFFLPGMIRERKWHNLQDLCTNEAGYRTPNDNQSADDADYQKQVKFHECLGLDSSAER